MSLAVLLILTLLSATAYGVDKVVVIPLGSVTNINASINWKGEWAEGTSYLAGDAIQYQGNSYLCIQQHTSSTSDYPPHVNWDLMAASGAIGSKGDTGGTGSIGPQGPQGIQGSEGAQGPQGTEGIQGVDGTTGLQGPIGEAGPQGTQGIQGDIGPQGPAGASGVQVYDANNQYLGIHMGIGEIDSVHTLDIFVPSTNSILRLKVVDGTIYSQRVYSRSFYYLMPDCQGSPYVDDFYDMNGVLQQSPFVDATIKYWSAPLFSGATITYASARNINSTTPCNNGVYSRKLVPVQLYTEEQVGFTMPLSFPLRFEIP